LVSQNQQNKRVGCTQTAPNNTTATKKEEKEAGQRTESKTKGKAETKQSTGKTP